MSLVNFRRNFLIWKYFRIFFHRRVARFVYDALFLYIFYSSRELFEIRRSLRNAKFAEEILYLRLYEKLEVSPFFCRGSAFRDLWGFISRLYFCECDDTNLSEVLISLLSPVRTFSSRLRLGVLFSIYFSVDGFLSIRVSLRLCHCFVCLRLFYFAWLLVQCSLYVIRELFSGKCTQTSCIRRNVHTPIYV